MSGYISYEERIKDFDWSVSERELEYKKGDIVNIGWYCSDRICQKGKADKIALFMRVLAAWTGSTPSTTSDWRVIQLVLFFATWVSGMKTGFACSWTGYPNFTSHSSGFLKLGQ